MTPQQITELNTTFGQFKEANEKYLSEVKAFGVANSSTQEKIGKIETALTSIEEKIGQQQSAADFKKEHEKVLARLDEIEAIAKSRGVSSAQAASELGEDKLKAKLEKKAFFKGLKFFSNLQERRELKEVLSADELKIWNETQSPERKALIVGSDVAGGYLAPPEYINEILMDVVQVSPIRSIARQRSTTRHSVQIPRRTSTAAAAWVGETGSRPETTNPAFGMQEIRAHELYAMTKVSWAELEDSAFDLEAFLRQEFSVQFAYSEGLAFVSGNATAKPEGFLTNTDVVTINSGSAATITPDSLIALLYEIKEEYLPTARYVLNRSTLKVVRQMKDSTGQYLWAPGIRSDSRPAEILGQPYVVAPDMPSVGAGNVAVAFGAFDRGYLILDRIVMEMMTDPYTSKSTGMVEFSARKRVGGQVILAEAIKTLTCSV
jgi:HK97 family phage major capsid protein